MTDKQALQEARRRWGKKGNVIHHQEWLPPWAMPYTVGIRRSWFDFEAFGQGMSWEEAFEAAERGEHTKRELFDGQKPELRSIKRAEHFGSSSL